MRRDAEDSPKVSVYVPMLNCAKYVGDCVDSILRQSHTDFEATLLDGGSTDGTIDLARRHIGGDRRFRLVCQSADETRGVYAAFNRCIAMAGGEFVLLLPADDVIASNFLELMTGALRRCPEAGLAVCPVRIFGDTDWDFIEEPTLARLKRNTDRRLHVTDQTAGPSATEISPWPSDGLKAIQGQNPYTSQHQILYRRETLENRRFRTDLGSTADIQFNIQTGLRFDVIHVGGTWVGWRRHDEQFSNASGPNKHDVLESMIHEAFEDSIDKDILRRTDELKSLLDDFSDLRRLRRQIADSSFPRWRRWAWLVRQYFGRRAAVKMYVRDRWSQETYSASELERRSKMVVQSQRGLSAVEPL